MNGTHSTRRLPLLASIGALAFSFLPASPVRAANILWNATGVISASTNVSLDDSLLYACNFGEADVTSATVNAVTFEPFAAPLLSSAMVTVGSVPLGVNLLNEFPSTNEFAGSPWQFSHG